MIGNQTSLPLLCLAGIMACSQTQSPSESLESSHRAPLDPDELALINELCVNPVGADDGFEYVELVGTPGATLEDVQFVVIEGDINASGEATYVVALENACEPSPCSFGPNGLLVIKSSTGHAILEPDTTVVVDPVLAVGELQNGSSSFMLIETSQPLILATDYDVNDDGVLELPPGATVLDAIGWTDGDLEDMVYAEATCVQADGTPDAASRLPDQTALEDSSWYCGDLLGDSPDSVAFDPARASENLPDGAQLTPGGPNDDVESDAGVDAPLDAEQDASSAGGGAGEGGAGTGGDGTAGEGGVGGDGTAGEGPGTGGTGGTGAGGEGTGGEGTGGEGTGGEGTGGEGTGGMGTGGMGTGGMGTGGEGTGGMGTGGMGTGGEGTGGMGTGGMGTGGMGTGGMGTGGTGIGGTGTGTGGTGMEAQEANDDSGCGCRVAGMERGNGVAIVGLFTVLTGWFKRRKSTTSPKG